MNNEGLLTITPHRLIVQVGSLKNRFLKLNENFSIPLSAAKKIIRTIPIPAISAL